MQMVGLGENVFHVFWSSGGESSAEGTDERHQHLGIGLRHYYN